MRWTHSYFLFLLLSLFVRWLEETVSSRNRLNSRASRSPREARLPDALMKFVPQLSSRLSPPVLSCLINTTLSKEGGTCTTVYSRVYHGAHAGNAVAQHKLEHKTPYPPLHTCVRMEVFPLGQLLRPAANCSLRGGPQFRRSN